MKAYRVSALKLERYRLGEMDPGEKRAVDEALALDEGLRSRLEELEESDRELRLRFPALRAGDSLMKITRNGSRRLPRAGFPGPRFSKNRALFIGVAAGIIAGIIIPVFYFAFSGKRGSSGLRGGEYVAALSPPERTKGLARDGAGLSVYLEGDQETLLQDRAVLEEGKTVQLAYSVPAGAERYGVIFSIDGRSVVTMHYPYRIGQSPLLVSGRRTFLSEAYTLDDAPGYEVFVMVVSDKPLDVDAVLWQARNMAGNSPELPFLVENSKAAFAGCEVETVTVIKK